MTRLVLALDFGGTKLSAALFKRESSRQGSNERQEEQTLSSSWRPLPSSRPLREPLSTLLDLRRVITPADADAAYELATIVALAREFLAGRPPPSVGLKIGRIRNRRDAQFCGVQPRDLPARGNVPLNAAGC